MEAYKAPAAPPMAPQIKGLKNLRLTPKIAGSVIPIKQDIAEGIAIDLVLWFLVFKATAKVAAPCAIFAAEAKGSQ